MLCACARVRGGSNVSVVWVINMPNESSIRREGGKEVR